MDNTDHWKKAEQFKEEAVKTKDKAQAIKLYRKAEESLQLLRNKLSPDDDEIFVVDMFLAEITKDIGDLEESFKRKVTGKKSTNKDIDVLNELETLSGSLQTQLDKLMSDLSKTKDKILETKIKRDERKECCRKYQEAIDLGHNSNQR